MAHFGTIPVPRTAIVPFAIAAARRAKIVAIVAAVACALCSIAGAADMIQGSSSPDRDDVAAMFWVGVFGLVCALAIRRSRRAMAAARCAAAGGGTTWTLLGKLVVAADERGQPVLEHSFRITRAQSALVSDQTNAVASASSS